MKRIGNVIRAQGVAMKLIEEYGFRRPAEIDLDSLIIDRGVEVRRGALRGCEARLVRIGQRGIIRVRDGVVGSPRSRFTLSHELGHWELHTDTQAFICTKEKFRDYKTDVKEAEANTFASELLMPTFMVRPLIQSNEPTLRTAKLIADEFNVSPNCRRHPTFARDKTRVFSRCVERSPRSMVGFRVGPIWALDGVETAAWPRNARLSPLQRCGRSDTA